MTLTAEPQPQVDLAEQDAVVSWLGDMLAGLSGLVAGGGQVDDAVRIDRLDQLERLKGAVAAVQAAEMVKFARSQVAAQQTSGVDYRRLGRGIADQIALACRVSPSEGSRRLGTARGLWFDLPHTLAALTKGNLNDYAASLIVSETRHLDAATRRGVDQALHRQDLDGLAPRQIGLLARKLTYQADPQAAVGRHRKARADRRVSLRPAPDTMAILSGLLPVEQGVACLAALKLRADQLIGTGDDRTRGQIMADTFVERLTGQTVADQVPVEVQISVPVETLTDPDSPTPADIPGFGPLPADLLHDLLNHTEGRHWWRRVFTAPAGLGGRTVVDADRRRRRFPGWLADLIRSRDQTCRDPFCPAPIRHLDHIQRYADDGPTTFDNGRGVCERGNHVREMPGWKIEVLSTHPHVTMTTTPTGHTYLSRAPQPP